MAALDHILFTRFNVRIWGGTVPEDDWMEHRFRYFDRYCYPAVAAQTEKRFKWLVLLDVDTSDRWRRKIEEYAEQSGLDLRPCYVPSVKPDVLAALLDGHVAPDAEHLITSRLDNDDTLSTRFIQSVRAQFRGQDYEYINFPNGFFYHLERKKLYRRWYAVNPFISLIEKIAPDRKPVSVLQGSHTAVAKLGTVRDILVDPLWLQIIHDRNVSNGLARCVRTERSRLGDDFVIQELIPEEAESRAGIALEQVVDYTGLFMRRYLLDGARRIRASLIGT